MADGLEDGGSLRAHLLQGETDQDRGKKGGQDRDVTGDDAQQEVHGAVGGCLLGGIVRGQLESLTRVDEVADHEADGQGER